MKYQLFDTLTVSSQNSWLIKRTTGTTIVIVARDDFKIEKDDRGSSPDSFYEAR